MLWLNVVLIVLVLMNVVPVARSDAGCLSDKFNTYFALKENGGIPVNRGKPMPLNKCISACKRYRACAAVSWDVAFRTCTWHSLEVNSNGAKAKSSVSVDKCCVYLRKVCSKFPTTTDKPEASTEQTPDTSNGATDSPEIMKTTRPPFSHIFRSTSPAPPESTTSIAENNTTSGFPGSESTRMTTIEPTTIPSFLLPSRISDSGSCPDPFERIENSSAAGGISIHGVDNEEDCKKLCLEDRSCAAADYIRNSTECVTHEKVVPGNFNRGNETCCTHFRKTKCERTCHVHGPVDLAPNTNTSNDNTTADIAQTAMGNTDICDGFCYTEENLSVQPDGLQLLSWTIQRGCTPSTRPSCHVTSQTNVTGDDVTSFSTRCVCQGDNCNALSVAALVELQLYLPLDGNPRDLSGRRRDGDLFNVQFDGYESRKGSAVYLDGSGFVAVPKLKGFIFGAINARDFTQRARFTLTLWMKRQGPESGLMTVVSTGSRSGPLVIVSVVEDGADFQHIIGSVTLQDGGVYVVQAQAPVDEWVFLVLTVTQSQQPTTPIGGAELQLFHAVDDELVDLAADRTELPDTPLQDNRGPLFLGCSPVSETGSTSEVQDCLRGYLDEVFLFSEALSLADIRVLQSLAQPVQSAVTEDWPDVTETKPYWNF